VGYGCHQQANCAHGMLRYQTFINASGLSGDILFMKIIFISVTIYLAM